MDILIKKGNHRPVFSFPRFIPRIVDTRKTVEYIFSQDTDSVGYKNHINKLFGYSIGFGIHDNSFRFGYNDSHGEIYAYYYIDGLRQYRTMQLYNDFKEDVYLRISRSKEYILFEARLSSEKKYTTRHVPFVSTCNYGFKLWGYYGGKPTATKDIKYKMKKIL